MGSKDVTNRLTSGNKSADQLAQELERANAAGDITSKRDVRRWAFAKDQRCVLTVQDETNAKSNIAAVPRNLSKTGAALVVGQFVYPGSRCVLALRKSGGKGVGLPATVARCRHVSGLLHEIGIHFDEPIDPTNFAIRVEDMGLPQRERVDPERLEGPVLFVEPEDANQRVIMHNLRNTNIEPIFARSGVDALELIDQAHIVFLDDELPDLEGLAWVGIASSMGCRRPMVVLVSRKDQGHKEALLSAGASAVLVRPVQESLLLQTLAEYLDQQVHESETDFDEERESHREVLLGLCNDLMQAIESGDKNKTRRCITTINGVATGFGFTAAAEVVQGFLERLDAVDDVGALNGLAQSLRQVCEREGRSSRASSSDAPAVEEGASQGDEGDGAQDEPTAEAA
jgi:CheY-like chemotaxis protein